MGRFEKVLRKSFYIVFIARFSRLFLNVIFNNMHFDYKWYFVLPLACIWFGLLFLAYSAVEKRREYIENNEKKVLILFFALLGLTQIFFFTQLASYPTRDLENVFRSAYYYAIQGQVDPLNVDYLYKHPNNLTWVIAFQFVFRIARKFGADAYLTYIVIASVINGIALRAGYFFTYLCCKKLMGVKQGIFALVLLYTCLPLQFNISFFYTDTLTMCFIPIAFYFYLTYKPEFKPTSLAFLAVTALALAFGIHLKYSVVIVLIAMGIDMLLKRDVKKLAAVTLSLAAAFGAWKFVLDGFTYSHILDREKAPDMATPFSSYIMMGLHGDGAFNVEDRYFAWRFDTKEEKEENIRRRIKARMAEFTPLTFLRHLNQKGVRSFGSGNMEYNYTISNSPVRQTFLVNCVSPGTPQYDVTVHIVQGWHVMLFVMVTAAAVISVKNEDNRVFVPLLSVFGLYLFLLLWEASQRYLINYMPMYIICAVYTMKNIYKKYSGR